MENILPMIEALSLAKGEMGSDDFWHGKIAERKHKFEILNENLNRAYMTRISLKFKIPARFSLWYQSGQSNYNAMNNTITLEGRLSLLTFIHEWAHVLGMGQREAIDWSQKAFKTVYPEKWSRLEGTDFKELQVAPNPRESENKAMVEWSQRGN